MATTIVTRAPTRIDFGGGWTDVPPYSDEMGGFVCNLAIARYATVTRHAGDGSRRRAANRLTHRRSVHRRRRGATISRQRRAISASTSDFPIGAGLGGSSAAGVAAVAAFAALRGRANDSHAQSPNSAARSRSATSEFPADDRITTPRRTAAHWASILAGRCRRRRDPAEREFATEIERRCIIVYTGQSRDLGRDDQRGDRRISRSQSRACFARLQRMREIAEEMAGALAQRRPRSPCDARHRTMDASTRAPSGDSNSAHRRDHRARAAAGAIGAKALGASGGGCVLVIARANAWTGGRDAIGRLGQILPFAIDERGVQPCQ